MFLEVVIAVMFGILLGGLILMGIKEKIRKNERLDAYSDKCEEIAERIRIEEIVLDALEGHVERYHKEK